jgi:hypothetical protein
VFCDCHHFALPKLLSNGTDIAWPEGWRERETLAWRNVLVRPSEPARYREASDLKSGSKLDSANQHIDVFSWLAKRKYYALPVQEVFFGTPHLASPQNV